MTHEAFRPDSNLPRREGRPWPARQPFSESWADSGHRAQSLSPLQFTETKIENTSMNIQFRIHGHNADASLRAWLEQQLEKLQNLIPITSAEVVLEHRRDTAPAFDAHVHLAVPGPDIHAAARDHTLEAAWLKVLKNLKKQIERRKTKQVTRAKTNRQQPASASRRSAATAGQLS